MYSFVSASYSMYAEIVLYINGINANTVRSQSLLSRPYCS